MRYRCQNPVSRDYPNYGGRGIKVCARWSVYENFLADMGRRPSAKHEIERNDNDGDYCAENCRWATREEQQNNKRNNRLIEHDGKRMTIAEWSRDIGVSQGALERRINQLKWSVHKALTEPPRGWGPGHKRAP